MSEMVLSPDAVIRFRRGCAVFESPRAAEPVLETDDAAVVAFVARFAVPQDPFQALRSLPAGLRGVAEGVLGRLVQKRVIVAAESSSASDDAPRQHRESILALRVLARSAALLAEDVAVLGPAGAQLQEPSGLGLERRVYGLLAGIDAIREELRRVRDERLAPQLQALFARHGRAGLSLHMGAGQPGLPGWVNINAVPADLGLNPRWGLPFDPGSVRRMVVHHVLERLEPAEVEAFLKDCLRVLEPRGILRLVLPAGANSVEHALRASGFGTVRVSSYMESTDQQLRVDEAVRAAGEPQARVYLEAQP